MSLRSLVIPLALHLLLTIPALAEPYTGTYTAQGPNGAVTLSFEEDATGHVTGTLSSGSVTWGLDGLHEEGEVVGTATNGRTRAFFEAELEGNHIHLTLAEIDPAGKPKHEQAQELVLTRTGKPASALPKNKESKRSSGKALK